MSVGDGLTIDDQVTESKSHVRNGDKDRIGGHDPDRHLQQGELSPHMFFTSPILPEKQALFHFIFSLVLLYFMTAGHSLKVIVLYLGAMPTTTCVHGLVELRLRWDKMWWSPHSPWGHSHTVLYPVSWHQAILMEYFFLPSLPCFHTRSVL